MMQTHLLHGKNLFRLSLEYRQLTKRKLSIHMNVMNHCLRKLAFLTITVYIVWHTVLPQLNVNHMIRPKKFLPKQ